MKPVLKMRASLLARTWPAMKPNETQAPQPRADHPQASAGPSSFAQPRSDCPPMSVGPLDGLGSHVTPRCTALRRNESKQAKRLKELEHENTQLKRLFGQRRGSTGHVQEACRRETSKARNDRRRAVVVLQDRFRVSQRRACPSDRKEPTTQRRPATRC